MGEKIAAAAVNLNNRIFTGADHAEALMKAESELGIPFDQMTQAPIMDGFTTTSGRFISRREAAEIAQREGQGETRGIFGATRGLASEDTSPAPAPAAAGNRTGATALGLMGGQGVWGVVQQPERPASGVLWHRSDRPASLDAAGLQDYEIQESLRNAWDNGYDSVLMKNYIRPGGTKPESIMVVRNLNQLRSPRAAFDPEKKLSPNILAGFGAVAAYPASSVLRPLDHDSDQSRIRTTDAGHGMAGLVPAIPIRRARCTPKRDRRSKSGDDTVLLPSCHRIAVALPANRGLTDSLLRIDKQQHLTRSRKSVYSIN